jgi:hypothetical protein
MYRPLCGQRPPIHFCFSFKNYDFREGQFRIGGFNRKLSGLTIRVGAWEFNINHLWATSNDDGSVFF